MSIGAIANVTAHGGQSGVSAITTGRQTTPEPTRNDEPAQLLELLTKAHWMAIEIVLEIETVMSNVSLDPDGDRAREIIQCLKRDVDEELGHARLLGERIEQRFGVAPGWLELIGESYGQPPERPTDIVRSIQVAIETQARAIARYGTIIELCGDEEASIRDLVTETLRDEQARRRRFEGFLREFEAERPT